MAFSLKRLLGINVADVINAVGDAVYKNVTNKKEKATLKNQLVTILLDTQTAAKEELTKRLAIDMSSDSKLTKLVRPLSMVFTTLIVAILAFIDGNLEAFVVKTEYIGLFKLLLILQYTFYFGSRGLEKVVEKIFKTNNKPESN